ncbi:MAG: GTP pyrophosphokinase [Actinobacteria bacterium 13_2_20CM_2_72_6]|nr:MAG: GTP pyrophosphokinase [Actinobacteria bacterium 13_2_20CM_2_72_6]
MSTPGAPTQRDTVPVEGGLTGRLRAMLPWPSNSSDEPVADLLRAHRQIHSHGDVSALRRAYVTAERMHRGQKRKSGEDYISHPLAVAQILADLGMDTTTLAAALLHDTVEDTSYTLPRLQEDFGPEVALLVDGVTKFDKGFFGDDAEVETIRKMLVKAGQDVRVLVIKLADRLHNMRTIDARSPASRVRIASATREVIVPLCDRLGIQALKRELEDTVLWALYSIWKDARAAGQSVPREIPRIVIIVEGAMTDCYAALGTVHSTWRPVPGRFKDFIASPKNNLYRSLHTTVLGPETQPLEVLIRTEPMHRAAEYGIVSNFRFPEYTARLSTQTRSEQLDWLRRVLDWQVAADDAERFLDALRCDLSESQIHVFTDDGRRIQLPSGSTPVDLAYTIGEQTGHGCVAAQRGGRLIPLSSPLSDGDVVEIVCTDQAAAGPSRDWLEFVKTPHARLQISQWFDAGEPATIGHKVRIGRAAIGLALRQRNRGLADDGPLMALADELGYPDMEALLVAVAEHRLAPEALVERMISAVDSGPSARDLGRSYPS